MKIYIFRHAQKAMDFSSDPDLNAEGHNQAQKLVDRVVKNELPTPSELWVSPKKRTCSTFRPLAEHLGLSLQLEEALKEQEPSESHSHFLKRIRNLCEKAAQKQGVLFLCSHYDWVIEALQVVPSDVTENEAAELSHWAPAQYAGFSVDGEGFFKFIELKRINP